MNESDRKTIAALVREAIDPLTRGVETKLWSSKDVGGEFKHFGDYLHTIRTNPTDARLKDLSIGADSGGGFLCPPEFLGRLMQDTIEDSVVRKLATVLPMGSDTLNIPKIQDTTHASNLFGGLVAYWTEEGGQKQETEPVFGNVKLIAKKLVTYTEVNDELLEDSAIALGALLSQMFATTIAWYEDQAFISGSGVGEPLGFLNSGSKIVITRATGNQIGLADLANLWARLLPRSRSKSVWVANPGTIAQLLQLTTSSLTWLSIDQGLANAPPARLLGRPIYFTEQVPALGSEGDICLCNFSYYLIGDRKRVTIDLSPHYKFQNDITCFRGVERVSGMPWVDAPFQPANGATLSPFVVLGTATS